MNIRLVELLKNIKKNIINFISIVVFIMLGVTLFQGLDFAGEGVKYSIEKTFELTNAYDVEVKFNTILSEEQIGGFTSIEGIDEVEGFYTVNDDFMYKGKKYSASISSMTNNIATCLVEEGHLPENDNEIAIYHGCSREIGLKVGDQITFSRNNMTSFAEVQVTSKNVYDPTLVNDKNFKNDTFTISAIVMQPEYLNHDVSSHGIDSKTGLNVEATFFVKESAFNPMIKGDYYNGIYLKSDLLKDYRYFDSEYKDISWDLKQKVEEYIYDSLTLPIDYNTGLNDTEVSNRFKEFLYLNGYITENTYNDDVFFHIAMAFMADEINAGEGIYINKIMSDHVGVLMGDILHDLIGNEKFAIGGIFFIVAFLICYSVINRLVNNEVKLIGTKKALGFNKKQITLTYICFTLIAVILGLIFGNLLSLVAEAVIVPTVFKTTFSLVTYTKYFDIGVSVGIALISIIVSSLITLFSCNGVIKKKAITLLQGDMKIKDKKESLIERTKWFHKLPLFNKTIFRNFKYEYKRIIATIIGIGSCVALLMGSFALKFNVEGCIEKELNQYNIYDTIVYMDTENENSSNNLINYFNEHNYEYSPIYRQAATYNINGHETLTGYIYVYYDVDSFNKLVKLDVSDSNPEFENKGFWLPESYQKYYECDNEADVSIVDFLGYGFDFKSTGFYKHYSYKGAIYVDYETYKEVSGFELEPNAFIINRHELDINTFEVDIAKVDGFLFLYDSHGKLKMDVQVFALVCNILFTLYGFAALLLSIFVVLNLFMENIREKKKELLTLIVNGYSRKRSSKYIYLDNIFLTLISLVIGFGFGVLVSQYCIVSMESVYLYFGRAINIPSALISISATTVIVFIITLISLREVNKFKLVEINQA